MKKSYQSILSDKKIHEILSDELSKEKEFNKKLLWYHGRSINRKKTENLLKSKDMKVGTFLVRDSFASHGDYVLSVRVELSKNQPGVEHFKIIRNPNDCFYKLEKSKHAEIHGLENLIHFHQTEKHGLPVLLDKYIPNEPPPAESREFGRTNALHLSIQGGLEQNVMNILKHKKHPDINSRDSEGTPVLYMACEAGMTEAVELLLRMQVKVCTKSREGYSALHIACKRDSVEIVKLLLDLGHASPVDICKDTRYSPMHIAAEQGNLDCIRVLLTYAAPDRPRDSLGRIPYELAKDNNRTNVVRFLDTYETVVDPIINRRNWLHEKLTRADTVTLFQKLGTTDGIFLIRKSSKGNTYALSLCFEQQIFHYEIQVMKNLVYYIDDGPMMTSFERIVSHYLRFSDGLPCKLKTAVSTDETLMELEIHPGGDRESDEKPKEPEEPEPSDGSGNYDEVAAGGVAAPPPVPTGTRPTIPSSKHKSSSMKDPLSSVVISRKHIALGNELGQGEFGSVLKATYSKQEGLKRKSVQVAVKTLLDSPLTGSKDDFFREARVMLELDHPNVVHLIGVCEGPPVMIIQELVKMGSMLDYLWDNEEEINVDTDLILWAAQIANGMKYLEAKKFVHRDLACRNILLAEKTLAKISDFGLSRAVGTESDYYKASKGGRWPVKWYAPESVNYGTFSHASDVWSYGVTLYEMFTFGEQPYGEKSGAEVIQMLDRGYRLEKPPKCPNDVYDLMKKCWSAAAGSRPTFEQLYSSFSSDPSFSRARSIIGQQKRKKGKHKFR